MHRHPHVLNAASNLLGICFVLIGALKFTHSDATSFADETAWVSAAMFLASIVASYVAIRSNDANRLQIPTPITTLAGLRSIAAVGINLRVQVRPRAPSVVVNTMVHIRNVDYNPNS